MSEPSPTTSSDLSALEGRVFDAVLFDLDGTLVDSTAAVVRSWLTWALERGIDPLRLQGYHGVPASQIVRELVDPADVEHASSRIDELELADVTGIVALPGAEAALGSLPAGRAAIVTSCTAALAQARLGATGIAAPGVLVTADQVSRGKPDPEPFLTAAERLGVPAERCLVVEDAPSGLTAARAAGMATLAVVTTTPRDELHADAVVTNLADVAITAGPDGVRVRPAA